MENSQGGVLTEQHLAVFGTILQCFARYELTIEQVIANVLQTDVSSIPILMRHHDFLAKRLALLDLLRDKSIPNDRWERRFAHLAVPHCHVGLRDHIAHSTWMASPETKSIQPDWILRPTPSIEPTCLGPKPENSSYTFQSLGEIAANLVKSHAQFHAYLIEADLIANKGL
jgi:hypothetical protein